MALVRHFIVYGKYTSYRIVPNPDGSGEDFADGALLQFSDDCGLTWEGHFVIAADCLNDLGNALKEADEYV